MTEKKRLERNERRVRKSRKKFYEKKDKKKTRKIDEDILTDCEKRKGFNYSVMR